jgi:hypothetical protein
MNGIIVDLASCGAVRMCGCMGRDSGAILAAFLDYVTIVSRRVLTRSKTQLSSHCFPTPASAHSRVDAITPLGLMVPIHQTPIRKRNDVLYGP